MQAHQLVAELCDRLVECGIPLWRVAVFVRTLRSHIMGRRFIWRPGAGVDVREAPFDLLETAEFRGSPVVKVYASGMPVRRRLADADCPIDFPMLRELQDEGVSDYLASPLLFTDGDIHLATWTTRQPDGFTDAQIEGIESIIVPFARVAEIRALRRTAANLLDTYVGNNAGEHILAGAIRRGHAEAIYAAIWLSDMRGFTLLADRVPPQNLLELLNEYFDCQVPAILEHGGEVLNSWATACWPSFRSEAILTLQRSVRVRWLPHMRREEMSLRSISRCDHRSVSCVLDWRFTLEKYCTVTLALATVWISPALVPQ
jgi:adenylate cyclase